jgi:hypothetical protein
MSSTSCSYVSILNSPANWATAALGAASAFGVGLLTTPGLLLQIGYDKETGYSVLAKDGTFKDLTILTKI